MNKMALPATVRSLMLFALVMGACAAPAGAPAAEAPAATEAPAAEPSKVEIEIWTGQGEYSICMQEAVVDVFNAQSATTVVKSVAFEEAWDTTRTALAGGEGPDIVVSPGPSFVFELVQAGQILALDDFAAELGWKDRFAEFALSLGNVQGKLYSLPDQMETLVVYYNKTLFDTNGWKVPGTMDELNVLAAKIKAAGIIPFTHANAEWRAANEWHVGNYLNHVAGADKVHAALTGKIQWTDPDFIAAIEMLNEAQQNNWWMGGKEFYYTTTFDDMHASIAAGEGAMSMEGSWAMNSYHETHFAESATKNDWGWFPIPTSNGDTLYTLGMGDTSSINAKSAHPQEAAEYLDYVFSADVQAKALSACGKAPAPIKIPEGTITGLEPRIASMFEALSKAAVSGQYGYTTWTFFPPKTDVYIYEEIEKVWAGDMTPEEYMVGLNTLFQSELAAGDIPKIPDR